MTFRRKYECINFCKFDQNSLNFWKRPTGKNYSTWKEEVIIGILSKKLKKSVITPTPPTVRDGWVLDHWIMPLNSLLLYINIFLFSSLQPKPQLQATIPLKSRLSPSKTNLFLFASMIVLKMMENAFYFILKALFVLQIFKLLSWLFEHVEKKAWLER